MPWPTGKALLLRGAEYGAESMPGTVWSRALTREEETEKNEYNSINKATIRG